MEDDETEGTNADSSKSVKEESSALPIGPLDPLDGKIAELDEAEKAQKAEELAAESFDEEDEVLDSSSLDFEGFKPETQGENERKNIEPLVSEEKKEPETPPSGTEKRIKPEKLGKITEYAQYLGLQPASKQKCLKCTSNSPRSASREECVCQISPSTCNIVKEHPGIPEPGQNQNSILEEKFKINRKVVLCAACETYFENWNLFLHMRDVHQRHICLYCLGMFAQAERLSHHLEKKHGVLETPFDSVNDFYQSFEGSCFLVCCSCEKVFNEKDNFYNHYCPVISKETKTSSEEEVCSNCRQSGSHSSSCKFKTDKSQSSNDKVSHKRLLSQQHRSSRVKNNERGLINSYQRKLSDMYERKMNLMAQKRPEHDKSQTKVEENVPIENSLNSETEPVLVNLETPQTQTSVVQNDEEKKVEALSRDTVAETIFEVSKCVEEKTGNNVEEIPSRVESNMILHDSEEKPSEKEQKSEDVHTEKTSTVAKSTEDFHDSVTETIMRVSRENTDQMDLDDQEEDRINENNLQSRTAISTENDGTHPRGDSTNLANNSSMEISDNESLFSPKHGSHLWERDKNNIYTSSSAEDNEEENEDEEVNVENDEAPIVSVSSVKTNDRRLVIKICTNKNSSFRVSATSNGIGGDPSESEENNNEENNSGSDEENLAPLDDRPKCSPRVRETSSPHSLNLSTDSPTKQNAEISEDHQQNLETKDENPETLSLLPNLDENPSFSDEKKDSEENEEVQNNLSNDGISLAPEDVPSIDLNVVGTLESTEIVDLLRKCIEAASPTCVYCNHAREIAVNGKQLALHMLSEHNFQPQHPAIIIHKSQFILKVKKSLEKIDSRFFNYDSYDSTIGTYSVRSSRIYECFHCRITSLVHKEISLHNRKMHQNKSTLICIMCKSTFFSYSELLCHLCPGIYSTTTPLENQPAPILPSYQQPLNDIKYRCCSCPIGTLPSAFRLMVHLRKSHHTCDICLEITENQQKLSNHVWKHKLHHLCYRCGIAYRNKPDITKHLFWKHGTESVVCKKCLQKKWPHIYHFCIPPNTFACEECSCSFSKAVALKVHKRMHTKEEPHCCEECPGKFISKKLLERHDQDIHNPLPISASSDVNSKNVDGLCVDSINGIEDPESMNVDVDGLDSTKKEPNEVQDSTIPPARSPSVSVGETNPQTTTTSTITTNTTATTPPKKPDEPVKKVVDVYDLPPLNLSSDSDSEADADEGTAKKIEEKPEVQTDQEETKMEVDDIEGVVKTIPDEVPAESETVDGNVDDQQQVTIMNGIWDNFKSYAASLRNEVTGGFGLTNKEIEEQNKYLELISIINAEHDYCVVYGDSSKDEKVDENELKNDENLEENNKTSEKKFEDDGENFDQVFQDTDMVDSAEVDKKESIVNEEKVGVGSDSEKKKTKSPKKKKKGESGNASSSSSDSSSDSDSSSCSCGTNCSCSSSSSGSSSSSSSSSDSDSTASEGSPKKSLELRRKDRKKDKKLNDLQKRKKDQQEIDIVGDNENRTVDETLNAPNVENNVDGNQEVAQSQNSIYNEENLVEETKKIIRESELETSETETDEDFYDEHPQELANKMLAEKRNQLLLVATAAAPASTKPLNLLQNGSIETPQEIPHKSGNQKRKKLTKKRKKGAAKESKPPKGTNRSRGRSLKFSGGYTIPAPEIPQTVGSIKLNIPTSKAYRAKQKIRLSLPNHSTFSESPVASFNHYSMNNSTYSTSISQNNSYSASESDNKRASKRRRIPKKFYGDSSDEEQQLHEKLLKFRRTDPPPPLPSAINLTPTFPEAPQQASQHVQQQPYIPSITIKQNFGNPPTVIQNKIPPQKQSNFVVYNNENTGILPGGSVSDSEDANDSSSDSSASEVEEKVPEVHQMRPMPKPMENFGVPGPTSMNRPANLYCYCQCPYDEVSEMIACDGSNCKIEWFHFECVGISVPPKGKWYCPDCRKTDANAPKDEEYND